MTLLKKVIEVTTRSGKVHKLTGGRFKWDSREDSILDVAAALQMNCGMISITNIVGIGPFYSSGTDRCKTCYRSRSTDRP